MSGYISAYTKGIPFITRCNTNTTLLKNDTHAYYTCNYVTKKKKLRNADFRSQKRGLIDYVNKNVDKITNVGMILSAGYHFAKLDVIGAHMAGLFLLSRNRFFSTNGFRFLFLTQLIDYCHNDNIRLPIRKKGGCTIVDPGCYDFLFRDYRLSYYCYYEFTMLFRRVKLTQYQYNERDRNRQNSPIVYNDREKAGNMDLFFFRDDHTHFKSTHGLQCRPFAIPRIFAPGNCLDNLEELRANELLIAARCLLRGFLHSFLKIYVKGQIYVT